jgi:hypothetical protein
MMPPARSIMRKVDKHRLTQVGASAEGTGSADRPHGLLRRAGFTSDRHSRQALRPSYGCCAQKRCAS